MAVKQAFEGQDDYTWDDFGLVDRSWDEWFADKWEPGGVFQIRSTTSPNVAVGSTINSSSQFESVFIAGLLGLGSSVLSSQFTQTTNITVSSTINPSVQFTTVNDLNVLFAGSSSILGAFTPTVLAKTTFEPQSDMGAAFSLSVVTGRNSGLVPETMESLFRMFFVEIADPFNSIKVKPETRLLNPVVESLLSSIKPQSKTLSITEEYRTNTVDYETRLFTVMQETHDHRVERVSNTITVPEESRLLILKSNSKVNSITEETLTISVEPETRVITIKRSPVIDILSVPRVRGD